MEINLVPDNESEEAIDTHYPAPCSSKMLKEMRALQKVFGRSVNAQLRKCMREMIEKNRDKLEKAS